MPSECQRCDLRERRQTRMSSPAVSVPHIRDGDDWVVRYIGVRVESQTYLKGEITVTRGWAAVKRDIDGSRHTSHSHACDGGKGVTCRSVEVWMMMSGRVSAATTPTPGVGGEVQKPHDRRARSWGRHGDVLRLGLLFECFRLFVCWRLSRLSARDVGRWRLVKRKTGSMNSGVRGEHRVTG